MVLLDRYLQVIERTPEGTSMFFKVAHLTVIAVTCATAIATSYFFGAALKCFGFKCILYADLQFTNSSHLYARFLQGSEFPDDLPKIDSRATKWGSTELCNYVHFSILTAGIFAFIWGAFFMISGHGGSGRKTDSLVMPWRIVFPAMLFTTVYTIFIIHSHSYLHGGTEVFCSQFAEIFNTTSCTKDIDVYSLHFNKKEYAFSFYMTWVRIGSQICMWSWIAQLVLLFVRFFIGHDFKIMIVSIYSEDHFENLHKKDWELLDGSDEDQFVTVDEDEIVYDGDNKRNKTTQTFIALRPDQ